MSTLGAFKNLFLYSPLLQNQSNVSKSTGNLNDPELRFELPKQAVKQFYWSSDCQEDKSYKLYFK